MSEEDKDRELTAEDARKMLEQERDERLRRCNAKIARILEEENCQLVGVPEIQDGRIVALVRIVAG